MARSKKQFLDFVRRSQATLVRLEHEQVQVTGERATIRAKITVRSTTSQEAKQDIQEQQWIKINGKWLLDSYRSLQ